MPQRLLEIEAFPGVSAVKMERLHGVARAALNGLLDRDHLRSLETETAERELRGIPGIGPFFAQGILFRGSGLVDALTDDDVTKHAIQVGYGREKVAQQDVIAIAEAWRPYRMWAQVLLHVWVRQEIGLPKRTFTRPS